MYYFTTGTDPDDEKEVEEADAKVRKRMQSRLQGMPAVPPEALETIASMLRFLPASRPSAEDVLKSVLLLARNDAWNLERSECFTVRSLYLQFARNL